MAFGDLVDLSAVPYLDHGALPGRFVVSLMFHDGGWRAWLQTEEAGRLVEVHAWPAEAFYFAREPADIQDLCIGILTFVAQRANFLGLQAAFSALQDDILNLSASLAKLCLIHESAPRLGGGATRLAATEVEYILLVCRSIFDLLQEFLARLWTGVRHADARKPKALKKTFSDMALHANTTRPAGEIAERFELPLPLAECYARNAPLFLKIREFRNNLVHRGHQVQTIFHGEEGFTIRKRLGPFLEPDIWRDDEVQRNGLVPLTPALAMVVHGTLAACDDFAHTLLTCLRLPAPTVPAMNLYMRGYFNAALTDALADAAQRSAEGRSLVAAPVRRASERQPYTP